MSAASVNARIENEEEIDFTASATASYGNNAVVEKTVATNTVYAMIAGDANNDDATAPSDNASIISPYSGFLGYHNGDVNLDGSVAPADNATVVSPNSGKLIQITSSSLTLDSRLTGVSQITSASQLPCWKSP